MFPFQAIRFRPVSESDGTNENERDFSRERATIHTSESKRPKFKTAHDFTHVLAILVAFVCLSVCLSVSQSHSVIVSKRCKLGSQNLYR